MSPRAAWRLEALGFVRVHDYVVGKSDWLAAGLPTEGDGPQPARVAASMDRSVVTCTPQERAGDVAARLDGAGAGVCVVLNDHHVVQGRIVRHRVDAAEDRLVEEVMEPGPATVRADAPLAETVERMRSRHAESLIVSTPDGVLLGVLRAVPVDAGPG
ncbi:MAG: CBS domain-containing protein [Acidimicrobiales bacterium]